MTTQNNKEAGAGRLLGIDFGRKRVGIALSDEEQKSLFQKLCIRMTKAG